MRIDKNIVVIGLSEEDTAHLRLLIRQAGARLAQRWRWGNESGADLVVVDPGVFAGQMARTRSLAAGMRCAIVSDEPTSGPDLALQRPFKLENVVSVLNLVGSGGVAAPSISRTVGDFYINESGGIDSSGGNDGVDAPDLLSRMMEEQAKAAAQAPAPRSNTAAAGLDDVLRQDAASEKPRFRVPQNVGGETLVEATPGPTRRSEARLSDSPLSLTAKGGGDPGPNTLPPVKRGAVVDNSRHPFAAYLGDALLRGPAQIEFDGVPALTLDPKHESFHTPGHLVELVPYLREEQPRSAWRPVTTTELAGLRESQPAQPYSRLIWLNVLLHSQGRLASHLDPGGTYQLASWLEIEPDFRRHFKIATALMGHAAPLNEIASASGASMAEVFDMVNAYDALGLIRRQPRASLRDLPKNEGSKSGLLGRLRKPFGKK